MKYTKLHLSYESQADQLLNRGMISDWEELIKKFGKNCNPKKGFTVHSNENWRILNSGEFTEKILIILYTKMVYKKSDIIQYGN